MANASMSRGFAISAELNWHALRHPSAFIACGFGAGMLPLVPGTWGSALGVALWLLIPPQLIWQVGACVTVFLIGWLATAQVCRRHAVNDPSQVVVDEIVGVWITLAALPRQAFWLLVGFVLFRVFDILKPFPIRALERRFKGGFGVMIDDVAAGTAAGLVGYGAWRLLAS